MTEELSFKLDDIYKGILQNKDIFESYLLKIQLEKTFDKKIELAYKAILFANNSSTGYYSSDLIEDVFCELGQKNKIHLSKKIKSNSVLHVATEVYATGGHSRILERWIDWSGDTENHSVVLTKNSQKEIPLKLKQALLQKKGHLITLEKGLSDIQKGLELRKIASEYEKVILHVHMDDVIPLIAFGTNDFQRPVFFFNHADHRFWLGNAISDCILNFRQFGLDITKEYRGAKNNFILPLPMDTKGYKKIYHSNELRKRLSLPQDKKIIFTAGSAGKYKPLLDFNFLTFINNILNKRNDVVFVALGPTYKKNQNWKCIDKNRLILPGLKPNLEFMEYLSCADLVIDSFPMSGGTALLDAVSMKKPILSLHCPTGQSDFIVQSSAYCQTMDELLQKTSELLDDAEKQKKNILEVASLLSKENSKSIWCMKKDKLYEKFKIHHVHKFKSKFKPVFDSLDYFLYKDTIKIKRKLHIPYILDLYTYKKNLKKYKKLIFFPH